MEEETVIREHEGSALFNTLPCSQSTTQADRLNPRNPNSNRNNPNNGPQDMQTEDLHCQQTTANQTQSCFSCSRPAPAESAEGLGSSQGGVGSPSPTSSCCCSSVSSSNPRSCFFSAGDTTTHTTTTTETRTTQVSATGTTSKLADSVEEKENTSNLSELKPSETLKCPKQGLIEEPIKNNCSSSCKQIPSGAPSADQAAESYAAAHRGRYIKLKVRHLNTFTFKCCLDHKLQLTAEDISNGIWCKKCNEIYKNAAKFAKKKEGALLDDKISPILNLRCSRGHIFQLKATEYACLTKRKMTKWCYNCSGSSKLLCFETQNQAESWRSIGGIGGIRNLDKVTCSLPRLSAALNQQTHQRTLPEARTTLSLLLTLNTLWLSARSRSSQCFT